MADARLESSTVAKKTCKPTHFNGWACLFSRRLASILARCLAGADRDDRRLAVGEAQCRSVGLAEQFADRAAKGIELGRDLVALRSLQRHLHFQIVALFDHLLQLCDLIFRLRELRAELITGRRRGAKIVFDPAAFRFERLDALGQCGGGWSSRTAP